MEQNVNDRVIRGRTRCGETHAFAKLKDWQVREIRKLAGAESMTKIAKRFGVSHSTVSEIIAGKSWKHLLKEVNDVKDST